MGLRIETETHDIFAELDVGGVTEESLRNFVALEGIRTEPFVKNFHSFGFDSRIRYHEDRFSYSIEINAL